MIGRTLLHYRVTEKLGEGGMGVVYKAEDTRLKRDVAIKLLPAHGDTDTAPQRRFESEARAAAALSHPNITHVHAIEEANGEMFIVMEYVPGRELGALIESGELSFDRAITLALQIAAGLKAAHDKGIIHRDIKSANVMVTGDGHIKIMDFGLAKAMGTTRVTRTGTLLGTVDYMSPEQVRGQDVDQRSDIWSFGVVLYEMLAGRRPFHGDYDQAVMYAIANEDVPSPLKFAPDLPPGAVALVTRMLARNRDDRHTNMAEVIDALQSLTKPGSGSAPGERNRRKSDVKTALPGVAVLPFASIRHDPESDFLGFALADQIIGALAYVDSITVRPSSAVRKYQGQQVDIPSAGRDLHADFVLAGHFLKEANVVRLNVELVAARSNDLVWRDAIQVQYENTFTLQDIVCEKVLHGLKIQFPNDARDGIQADAPANPLAYEYYLQAVACSGTLSDNRLAIEMLDKSIRLDGNFAPAYGELGYRLAQGFNYGMGGNDGYALAEAAYRRALEINENQVATLGNLTLLYVEVGRHEEAIALLDRLLRLTPNNAWARFALSYICRYTGMMQESMVELDRAIKLDPRNPRFRSAGFVYMYEGNFERAYELFKIDEISGPALAWHGWALTAMGEHERAIPWFDRALAVEPDGSVALIFGSIRSFLLGDIDDARRRVRQLEDDLVKRKHGDGESWYLLTGSCSFIGDGERSVEWMRRTIEAGFFNPTAFERNPFLDAARAVPGYQQVLALAREKHERFKAAFNARS